MFPNYSKYIGGQNILYQGTVTGLRISAVDGGATESGGAFIDGLPTAIMDLIALYPGALRFEAYSTNGAMIWGVPKAAGSAEGVGSELITGWTNYAPVPYETLTSNGKDITDAIDDGSDGYVMGNNIAGMAAGKLYKMVETLTQVSGQIPITSTNINYQSFVPTAGGTYYYTALTGDTNFYMVNDAATRWNCVFTLKQVLAPSTSGATIVSAKGGTTYNFAYKNASFTYNAASYYCRVKRIA